MAMKDWFRGSKAQPSDPRVDIETQIAQGDLEEAASSLRLRLRRNNGDMYSRLKLAEVLMKLQRKREAVDEYLVAAETYARDGFFDKASALLRKISKMAPSNDQIALKIEALQKAKDLDRRRDMVINSLLEGDPDGERRFGGSALELQQLWTELCQSPVIEALSDDQLRRLFAATELVRYDEDQQVVADGEHQEMILLLGRGLIEARIPLKGGVETAIRSFSGGDLIGDRALLEHKTWPAHYVAAKRTMALKMTREGLASMLTGEADPKGLLDTLRQQRHDHQVLSAIRSLEASG